MLRPALLAAFVLGVAGLEPANAASGRGHRIVALKDFARHYGLDVTWIERGRRLQLSSQWSTLRFESDSREMKLNGVRVFLGEPVRPWHRSLGISVIDQDRLLIPILAARQLDHRAPLRLIAVDAGHGGYDAGTSNARLKLKEKTLTLDVARRLVRQLEKRGLRAMLTRSDDSYVGLTDRPQKAQAAGADLFVSIHFNAAGAADVHGIETYICTPQHQYSTGSGEPQPDDDEAVPGNRFDGWSANLGYTVHRIVTDRLDAFDRGLKHARFVVLRELDCPGLLIECGYLSNAAEARRISDPGYRDRIASAIAEGLVSFDGTLRELQKRQK